jgi:Tol biopolymer transport system component
MALRRLAFGVGVAAVTAVVVVASSGGAPAPPCSVVPVLRDVTVNQGLGSYDPLVRGKETLTRFYLSLPSCAGKGASIAVTAATMTVKNGSTTLHTATAPVPALVSPFPVLAPYTSAPALDSPADPTFVVPGAALVPGDGTSRFSATFQLFLAYSAKTSSTATPVTGSVMFTNYPGTSSPITKTFERRSGALRLLVVPLIFGTDTAQFPAAARQTTQNAMLTLQRIMPVPDGVGDLGDPLGRGLQYAINPGMINLSSLGIAGPPFCGTSTNFNALKGQLAAFLGAWNQANPDRKADRVLGAVDQSISSGSGGGCADGMASTSSGEAWVRVVAGTSSSPSPTGSTAAMELAHTMSLVLVARDNDFSPYHSANTAADGTALNRGFNVATRSFLSDDHTVMRVYGTWNDTNTILEKADWAYLLCVLGGQTTTECSATVSGSVGSTQNVPAGPAFVVRGSTDGTIGGTQIVSSHFSPESDLTDPDPASHIRFVQYDGQNVLSDLGVRLALDETIHDNTHPEGGSSTVSPLGFAFPFVVGADRIELVNSDTSEVLFARTRGAAPVVSGLSGEATSVISVDSQGFFGDPGRSSGFNFAATNARPVISDDGRFVVFLSSAPDLAPTFELFNDGDLDVFVRDRTAGTTERITGSSSFGSAYDPSISGDGNVVAFQGEADVYGTGDANGKIDVFAYDRNADAMTRVSLDTAGGDANEHSRQPTVSGNGRHVVFQSTASDLVASDTNGVEDIFVRDLQTSTTVRVSVSGAGTQANGYSSHPSISDDGRFVAFTSAATNLAASPATSVGQVYVHDRDADNDGLFDETGAGERSTEMISVTPTATAGNGNKLYTWITSDGRYVAFSADSTNLVASDTNFPVFDVFLRDRQAGTTERISDDSSEAQSNGFSGLPSVSDDGNLVVFRSAATNLVADDTNAADDIFLRDRQAGTTERVNLDSNGAPPGAGEGSYSGSISGDGRYIAFDTDGLLVAGDTNNATDVYLRDLQAGTGEGFVATADEPENLRLELYCNTADGVSYPLAIGVEPDSVDEDSATFGLPFDPELAGAGCETITSFVDDGFDQVAAPEETEIEVSPPPADPTAEILSPLDGETFLQYDLVALRGSCKDAEDGELTAGALQWTSATLAGLPAAGTQADLSPPAGGWQSGSHTVTLTCTDGDTNTGSASVSITILGDADHDGVATAVESAVGTSDSDPLDAYADADGDGVANLDDDAPTNPLARVAAIADFSPDTFQITSKGNPVTIYVQVPSQQLADVDPASVRIASVAGVGLNVHATSWAIVGTVATAKFSRQALVDFLNANLIANRRVSLTVVGESRTGEWSFAGTDSFYAKK